MAIYVETVVDVLTFAVGVEIYTESTSPYYGNPVNANTYYRTKLRPQSWFNAELDEQLSALREATRLIEALPFLGNKVVPGQLLHFPTSEHNTPKEVIIATYEIALMLLDGYESDREVANLMVTVQMYAGFRTAYDRSTVQEHIRAGIPSAYAWSILRPYLCDPMALRLI